jgi:prolipoprotein diacylglyceryl transferase
LGEAILSAACWTWNVDPILFEIFGPLKIRWYGLSFLGVFYVGYRLLAWQMERGGRDREVAATFVNWAVGGVILGSWFGHRFFYEWDRVLSNPLYLVDLRKGLAGLSSHGATVGLIVTLILFARRYRIPIGEMFDRFMWSCASGAFFVRLGNFFNSEIVGRPTDVSWAVCLPRHDRLPIPRHPTQLYEATIGLLILLILWGVDRFAKEEKRPRWLITGVFFTTYFTFRFFVEFFKAHQTLQDTSSLTMGQFLSIPFALLGVGMTVYALKSRKASGPVAMGLVEPGGIYDPFETKSTQGGRKEPRAKKSKKKKKGS